MLAAADGTLLQECLEDASLSKYQVNGQRSCMSATGASACTTCGSIVQYSTAGASLPIIVSSSVAGGEQRCPQHLLYALKHVAHRSSLPSSLSGERDSGLLLCLSFLQVLILDEAHERSLNTDILFGVIKKLLAHQQDRRSAQSSGLWVA